jgi:hypothetical protein
MRSSSTERRGFWPVEAGAWTRLTLVVVLGAGALAAPVIGVTGAIYTDSATVGFDVFPSVSPPPTTSATSTSGTTAALAMLAAPAAAPVAAVPAPAPTPTTTDQPASSPISPPPSPPATQPTQTPTPTPAPTASAPAVGQPAPPLWPVWTPGHQRH